MYKYTFFGRILPERRNVRISGQKSQFFVNKVEGTVSVWIEGSQLIGELELRGQHDNVGDLKPLVEAEALRNLNLLGYIEGHWFDVEILSCIEQDGKKTILGNYNDELVQRQKSKQYDTYRLSQLTYGENGVFLNRCFSDLSRALRPAFDSGFFAYRAMETIRNYFSKKYNKNKNQAWRTMRIELGVEKDDIMFLKQFADGPRHGKTTNYTGDDFIKINRTAWNLMDKFIDYALHNWK